jgi:hypothetical protein
MMLLIGSNAPAEPPITMMSRCGKILPSAKLEVIRKFPVGSKVPSYEGEAPWSGITVAGILQLHGVAILVHRSALLIDLAIR